MNKHPSKNELSGFILGKLPPDETEAVADHLGECPPCQHTLQEIEAHKDTLIKNLRQPAPASLETDPECRRAVEYVAGLVPMGQAEGRREACAAPATVAGVAQPSVVGQPGAPVPSVASSGETPVPAASLGRLREYELLEKLGQGGMGTVYKARHTRLDKIVAVKTLPADRMKSPQAIARFEREMRAVGKLEHPNLIRAFDAGEVDGTHFLVMEYVAGVDLSAIVKQHGRLSVADACELVRQAAVGLQYAHEHGLVHRDIKPSNLMLAHDGQVKILDLGLALLQDSATAASGGELTGTGQIMGTVDYMAPEQVGDSHTVDIRADIFSLGATLYKLLTGAAPFVGAPGNPLIHRLVALATKPHAPLTQDCPQALAKLVDRMLAKQPSTRPAVPAEIAAALTPFAAGHELTKLVGETAAGSGSGNPDTHSYLNAPGTGTHADGLPKAEVSLPEQVQPQTVASRPPRRLHRGLLLAAAGGAALLLLGIWVIIRGKDGNEVGRMKVPDEGSATIQQINDPLAMKVEPPLPHTPAPSLAVAPFDAKQARAHQDAWARHLGTTVETVNSVGAKMILIPPGEFLMGSTDAQVEAALDVAVATHAEGTAISNISQNERPQHRVVITKPFFLGATEVTVGQFKEFVAATRYQTEAEQAIVAGKNPQHTFLNPGYAVTDDFPAAVTSWNDAVAYCSWLSSEEKATYRLPTEAEWEYACRAGTTTQYSFGDNHAELENFARYSKNQDGKAHSVGTKLPNAFGLYDMHGNLCEWCQDCYMREWYKESSLNDPVNDTSGGSRVFRGGTHFNNVSHARSAYRSNAGPTHQNYTFGFRVVRLFDR